MASDISSLVSGQAKQAASTAITPPAASATPAKATESTDTFGPAVQLNLSSAAKTPAQASAPATQAPPPVAAQSAAAIDIASIISAAKRKVEPLVGASGASQVVDNKGNISKSKLAEVIAEQSTKS